MPHVGESEANVRKLFEDAEADQKANGSASELHVIIFDEIDAICKQRGSVQSGSGGSAKMQPNACLLELTAASIDTCRQTCKGFFIEAALLQSVAQRGRMLSVSCTQVYMTRLSISC